MVEINEQRLAGDRPVQASPRISVVVAAVITSSGRAA
jgi:hypothetical protein